MMTPLERGILRALNEGLQDVSPSSTSNSPISASNGSTSTKDKRKAARKTGTGTVAPASTTEPQEIDPCVHECMGRRLGDFIFGLDPNGQDVWMILGEQSLVNQQQQSLTQVIVQPE